MLQATARSAGVEFAEHAVVLGRAEAAVAKIQAGMERSQGTGLISQFDQEYARRGLQVAQRGRGFMSCQQARARLMR